MMLTEYMRQEKKEERGLANIEDSVDASIQRLKDYVEKRGERLITSSRNNTDNTRTNRTTITKKQKNKKKKRQQQKNKKQKNK